jgi:hypothetical protein
MKNYKTLTTVLVIGWFLFAWAASALHLFQNNSNRIGLSVAFAAVIPIVLFSLWFTLSKTFRQFVLSWNPRILTSLHSGRILGFTFVLLEARSILPAIFALPAGYGDMTIGITACFVAWKIANADHRNWFILWQMLGIADLVVAVSLGVTAPLISPYAASTAPMTVLPLSLIPTFLVPLYLILHIVCIAQARGWKVVSTRTPLAAKPLQFSAN